MRCFDAAQIARAASLRAPLDDEPHFGECLDCHRRLEADRAARDALRILPVPMLGDVRRRALAAEIIASAEHLPNRRRRPFAVAGVLAAAAAVAAVLAWPRDIPQLAPSAVVPASPEPTTVAMAHTAHESAPPALSAPSIEATHGTTFRHTIGNERDAITLADGALTLDTRSARPVDVQVGDAVIRVTEAAVTIRARGRSIVSVHVVIGSARIDSADQQVTLARESIWLPGPSAKMRSLSAFRDAWIALRAGRHHDAMVLFDRVTDPVVLEEASYWGVVAARRAGDPSVSARIAKFLRAFPTSTYAAELERIP